MKSIYDYTLSELIQTFEKLKIPKFRAKQVFNAIYKRGLSNYADITTLSLPERKVFSEIVPFMKYDVKPDVGVKTTKYLLSFEDDYSIEFVVINSGKRTTLCVSSQVGCSLKCSFCATGGMGFGRDLTPGEIVLQVVLALREFKDIDNIVFMGMGEPLLNFDNVFKAIDILNSRDGLDFGMRRIIVSTVGIIPGIQKLINSGKKLNLAISLHAANNSLRSKLVPINKKYSIEPLLAIANEYRTFSGRRISFEYVLLSGINDQVEHARELVSLVKGSDFHINLIPYNQALGEYESSSPKQIAKFMRVLEEARVNVTVRKSEGADVGAACGMLAGRSFIMQFPG